MTIVVVTGTPGTGKSTVAKELARRLKYAYLDGKRIIRKYELSEGTDTKRKVDIVDEKLFAKACLKEIKEKSIDAVVDSHLSHAVSPKKVTACIVMHCDLKKLQSRLKKRRYSQAKIAENLEAETFDVCGVEAKEAGHNVIEIDTTKKPNYKELIAKINNG